MVNMSLRKSLRIATKDILMDDSKKGRLRLNETSAQHSPEMQCMGSCRNLSKTPVRFFAKSGPGSNRKFNDVTPGRAVQSNTNLVMEHWDVDQYPWRAPSESIWSSRNFAAAWPHTM